MAVNTAMEKMGVVRPGMNCAKVGSPEAHKGCLANKALAGGEAVFGPLPLPGRDAVSFLIPLDGYHDFTLKPFWLASSKVNHLSSLRP